MSTFNRDLDLLLVHAQEHVPILDRRIALDSTVGEPAPDPLPQPGGLWSQGGDPNDLETQGWGVIAPLGDDGDRLLDLVHPLLQQRRLQQDGRQPKVYRVPSDLRQLSEAARWKKRIFNRGRDLDTDLPRYQLILGDLHQVSLAVQQVQATDGFVGRLAFDRDDDYRAYVDKVLRWEQQPASIEFGDAILHSVHDGTAATRSGHKWLMKPGMDILYRQSERGKVKAADVRESGTRAPNPDELRRAVQDACASVLFTMSHGVGAPPAGWRTADDQRRLQGAMSFGQDGGQLSGEDLMKGAFLPGGVWFMLSCFSAGTADSSAYAHWLKQLAQVGQISEHQIQHISNSLALPGERPFITSLPKATLANPEGPLAFIGHVDLAWSYGFRDFDQRPMNRPGRFMSVIQSLLGYKRVGVGYQALNRFLTEVNTELTALYDEHEGNRRAVPSLQVDDAARLPLLWMLRQDLIAYILLGDPALRLPLNKASTEKAKTQTTREAISTARMERAAATAQLPMTLDKLEIFIGKVLGQMSSLEVVAHECGITSDTLGRLVEQYRQGGRQALDMVEE